MPNPIPDFALYLACVQIKQLATFEAGEAVRLLLCLPALVKLLLKLLQPTRDDADKVEESFRELVLVGRPAVPAERPNPVRIALASMEPEAQRNMASFIS